MGGIFRRSAGGGENDGDDDDGTAATQKRTEAVHLAGPHDGGARAISESGAGEEKGVLGI